MAKVAVANVTSSCRVSRIELDGSERILQLFNHWDGPPSIKDHMWTDHVDVA